MLVVMGRMRAVIDAVDEREAKQRLEARLGELFAQFTRRVEVEEVLECVRVDRAAVEDVEHLLNELRWHEVRVCEYVVAYQLDYLAVDELVVLDRLQWQFATRYTLIFREEAFKLNLLSSILQSSIITFY